ncbi:SCP2 domain-containing protein [Legionella sp. km772]|uniref:ubiquinone biosynthesis accessory factor UbiJ n=1 Tax=Legionella sp. km772 TaxID=2498111 RepID=UPI000F8F4431|nr:SCP2 sterol-binding domain-containing protein [Legionella sp. km772]RUR08134.1 hypothetical protein ELY15_11415 [Legionella sp. km772]
MLKKYSLKTLQLAINTALNLDEGMPEKLNALEGKVLKLVITPLNAYFFIHFLHNEILLLEHYEGQPDTFIHSSPLGLIRLSILPSSQARSLFNDQIRIEGDVELGQKIKQLFDEMDIDWEGHLAQFTGDIVAYQIGSLVRKGIQFKQQLSSSMRLNVSDYLQEELRLVPSQNELDDFFRDIDELSLDVERLTAHINELMSHS